MGERFYNAHSRWCKRHSLPSCVPRLRFTLTAPSIGGLMVALLLLGVVGTAQARHPLESVDTSSPRATMESFFLLTKETARRYFEFRDSPSPATQEALLQVSEKAGRLFDLSQVPPAIRHKIADETFYLLWEVLSRLELADFKEIPDLSDYTVRDETAPPPNRWKIPRTDITIVRVEEGPRSGEFLFSSDSVKGARRFYETARELPYLRPMPIENVYRLNQLVTGWMIPMAWVEALPAWANTTLLGQVLWKWCALLLLFGLAMAAMIGVFRWVRRRSWEGSLRSYLRHLSTPLAILVVALLLRYFAMQQINVTGAAAKAPDYFLELGKGVAAVWFIWLTTRWTAETIIASSRKSSASLDISLIRLSVRSVGVSVLLLFLFRIAHNLGVPVYGLVAGAGVGGLAIALATRSTLENFMGTLNLYADRPVHVGDFCRYGEDPSSGWLRIGTVEEIGLRSTRIRGIDRTITTIPNAEFSNMHIVNLTKRDLMLFRTTIALRYDTTPDQLRSILFKLREMLVAHDQVTEVPARVRAAGFGEYAINVDIFAYVNTSDWDDFLAVQEDLVLRTIDIVRKAGTAFAYPSRTVYRGRDAGLDNEPREVAEK